MPTENRSSNTEMAAQLSPCPHCGQQDAFVEQLDSDASVVICQGRIDEYSACLARGPVGVQQHECEDQPGHDQAVKDWNKRAAVVPHPDPIAWMVGTAFWWTKEEAERDAAETGLPIVGLGPMTGAANIEQHQGEPEACSHEWTDDGEFMLVCTACGAQENHDPKWRDMATAPRDGTLVRLLVEFTEHATEDRESMPSPTIGANSYDHTGEDVWQFAGWSWEQDCFTQGQGEPVGWLPLLDTPHPDPAEAEQLRAVIDQQKTLIASLRAELVESYSIDASAEPSAPAVSNLPELTDDLREILGRPNFTCHFIAKALRIMGHSIAPKSEDEQAVVIHWLLGHYLKNGSDWRLRAEAELKSASEKLAPSAAPQQ
ncbi:Lar family restriction alleviation protein [Pseudomonas fulva]|uniref:Lar family restriction alleviation protein n=1 Tax=Pseudomonas fulva TaxID=47880 RepID=UPI000AC1701A|nr:hypothetical protein [Pseudomonas fulva]